MGGCWGNSGGDRGFPGAAPGFLRHHQVVARPWAIPGKLGHEEQETPLHRGHSVIHRTNHPCSQPLTGPLGYFPQLPPPVAPCHL